MLSLLAHINEVRAKLFSAKHRRKMTRYYDQEELFLSQNRVKQPVFLITRQRSDVLIRNYLERNTNLKVPYHESCNVNDLRKDGLLNTARALSLPVRQSLVGYLNPGP